MNLFDSIEHRLSEMLKKGHWTDYHPLLKGLEKPNQVVRVIGKTHKYRGEEAVIQYETPKMYHIRLLDKKKPLWERFGFCKDGKVCSTSSDQITMYISKTGVEPIPGRKAPTLLNKWQDETGNLLAKYRGKTKAQVQSMIGQN